VPPSSSSDQSLDYAERWLLDGLRVLRPALSVHQTSVDMTNAIGRLESLRKDGVHASSTHLLVSAAAQALARNPAIHQMIAGVRRHRPPTVDIGLSIAGDTFIAPVLVIERADTKSVAEIAAEVARRTPEVQAADRKMHALLNSWGRFVPIGAARRMVLRALFRSGAFRRKGVGSFQVSTVPVDWALSATFSAPGLLVGGQTWPRVVAVDGQPVVRPMMTVTLSSDHGVWDGRAAARFLASVKTDLEMP
jgi:pyruvate dehydrogenase E2 component (dihydrolipoamide acetyltransferase)